MTAMPATGAERGANGATTAMAGSARKVRPNVRRAIAARRGGRPGRIEKTARTARIARSRAGKITAKSGAPMPKASAAGSTGAGKVPVRSIAATLAARAGPTGAGTTGGKSSPIPIRPSRS